MRCLVAEIPETRNGWWIARLVALVLLGTSYGCGSTPDAAGPNDDSLVETAEYPPPSIDTALGREQSEYARLKARHSHLQALVERLKTELGELEDQWHNLNTVESEEIAQQRIVALDATTRALRKLSDMHQQQNDALADQIETLLSDQEAQWVPQTTPTIETSDAETLLFARRIPSGLAADSAAAQTLLDLAHYRDAAELHEAAEPGDTRRTLLALASTLHERAEHDFVTDANDTGFQRVSWARRLLDEVFRPLGQDASTLPPTACTSSIPYPDMPALSELLASCAL